MSNLKYPFNYKNASVEPGLLSDFELIIFNILFCILKKFFIQ